ncbi:hypothetical protein L6R49_16085 [Myxococcota bacterium]|nr:hypothetical protein [Myxococcota bacterium]
MRDDALSALVVMQSAGCAGLAAFLVAWGLGPAVGPQGLGVTTPVLAMALGLCFGGIGGWLVARRWEPERLRALLKGLAVAAVLGLGLVASLGR